MPHSLTTTSTGVSTPTVASTRLLPPRATTRRLFGAFALVAAAVTGLAPSSLAMEPGDDRVTRVTGGGGGGGGSGGFSDGFLGGNGGDGGIGDGGGDVEDEGWTEFVPDAETRIIYVSSSSGTDWNNYRYHTLGDSAVGDDPFNPRGQVQAYKTLEAAVSQLRANKPDWLLLKRGDTWVNQQLAGNWEISGAGPSRRMLVASYGNNPNRPKIKTGTETGLQVGGSTVRRHLAFVGLHFEPHTRTPNDNPHGIRWVGSADNILFEDCYVSGYHTNVNIDPYNGATIRNVTFRRCIIVDAWGVTGHAQGLYATHVDGLTLEGNVFDHNGWHETIPGAEATTFNHNVYMTTKNTRVTARENIIARASATGMQARSGGDIENNLFISNAFGLNFGWSEGGAAQDPEGVPGNVVDNVFQDGFNHEFGGWGIAFGNVSPYESHAVAGNIFSGARQDRPDAMNVAGTNGCGIHETTFENNIVYNWGRNMRILGYPGSELTGLTFRNNVIENPTDATDRLIEFRDATLDPDTTPRWLTFHANSYDSARSNSSWFKDRAGTYSEDEWRELVDETPPHGNGGSFPDPGRTIATYNQFLGGSRSFAAFITEARQQSRTNWRPEYTADAANDYVRAGFGIEE